MIPGQYCDATRTRERCEQKLNTGDAIIDQTWRSDYRYLETRADTGDYGQHNVVR